MKCFNGVDLRMRRDIFLTEKSYDGRKVLYDLGIQTNTDPDGYAEDLNICISGRINNYYGVVPTRAEIKRGIRNNSHITCNEPCLEDDIINLIPEVYDSYIFN